MADHTNIEWCDATFNPWIGCTKVSPGCDHCYAATQDKFRKWTPEGWGGPRRRTGEDTWGKVFTWNDRPFYACPECGWRGETPSNCPTCAAEVRTTRRRVFCASLADVFDNQVDPRWRADLFYLIEQCPNLDFLLLTKRIGNVVPMVKEASDTLAIVHKPLAWPLPNVWLGATVVNQEEADRDIPKLLATPARVRFLSMEPLLGPVDLSTPLNVYQFEDGAAWSARNRRSHDTGLHWVIVGGESGPGARPMHPDWARSLRDQCQAAGVPFLFKQWGEWAPHPPTPGFDEGGALRKGLVQYLRGDGRELDGHFRRGDAAVRRVGKKAAGRLLDGVTHDGFPEVR